MVMLSLALARSSRRPLVCLSDLVGNPYRLHRTRQALANLDERTLRDVGLVPLDNDVWREKGLWDRSLIR